MSDPVNLLHLLFVALGVFLAFLSLAVGCAFFIFKLHNKAQGEFSAIKEGVARCSAGLHQSNLDHANAAKSRKEVHKDMTAMRVEFAKEVADIRVDLTKLQGRINSLGAQLRDKNIINGHAAHNPQNA